MMAFLAVAGTLGFSTRWRERLVRRWQRACSGTYGLELAALHERLEAWAILLSCLSNVLKIFRSLCRRRLIS